MSQLTDEEKKFLMFLNHNRSRITPPPYKVIVGRLQGFRLDIVPVVNEKQAIAHIHATQGQPKNIGELNPNWEYDIQWLAEATPRIDKLLEIIKRLTEEKNNGEQIEQ